MSANSTTSAIATKNRTASIGSVGSSGDHHHHDDAATTTTAQDDPLSTLEGLNDFHVDDLLSSLSSPSSPQHAASQSHSHNNDDDGWHVHHPGVHMHLQDNAKLPTFNLVVNRSAVRTRSDSLGGESHNSLLSPSLSSTTTAAAKRQEEWGFSKLRPPEPRGDASRLTAELFLSRSDRHADFGKSRSGSIGGMMDPLDALLAADLQDVDPTPLSEIKRRHETYHAQHPPTQPQLAQPTQGSPRVTTTKPLEAAIPALSIPPTAASAAKQGTRRAYSVRQHPLPIPTKKISPPGSPTKNGVTVAVAGSAPPPQRHSNSTLPTAATTAQTGTAPRTSHVTTHPQQPSSKAYSTKPAPAIHRASTQKAQYGFGSNHTVASIPPLVVASRKRKPSASVAPPAKAVARPTAYTPPPSATAQVQAAAAAAAAAGNNQGAAYERKKQRAKDARVKLNESIERLSVAIGLAGTQSRERLTQWNALASSGLAGRQAGLDICSECVGTAESAKKWDRPSFVGSAASLIQQLNAQCEALMRELVSMHQQHESDLGRSVHPQVETAATEAALAATVEDETSALPMPVQSGGDDHNDMDTSPTGEANPAPAVAPTNGNAPLTETNLLHTNKQHTASDVHDSKRQRVGSIDEVQNGVATTVPEIPVHQAVFLNSKLMIHVASFLEPLSLSRCRRVSKTFQSMEAFSCEQVWQEFAAARFGFFNVRQWHAKLDDDDMGISTPSTTLYRSMDRANVMPTFSHEGMFLLGEARLPNKVSAWAFLVERSNGETLRCTRRRSDMPGKGDYTSLPVVEIRTVIQNTGCSTRGNEHIAIRDQTFTVDASTRRRGEEMKEVDWDDRFHKRIENLDGTPYIPPPNRKLQFSPNRSPDLAQLRLYESVVVVSYIYARGCSTNSKFVQRSNFSKVLVGLTTGVTLPLVIPFPRDASHLQH